MDKKAVVAAMSASIFLKWISDFLRLKEYNSQSERNFHLKLKMLLLFPLLLFVSGCPGNKDPYTASMQASLQVSDAVAQAIPIVQQLQSTNQISVSEANSVYGYLISVSVGNQVFRQTARSLHASGNSTPASYIGAADTFIKGVNSQTFLTAIHISNPQSQQKVMLYLQAVDTVLSGIETIIQNNTVTPAPAPTVGGHLWMLSNHDSYPVLT